MGFELLEDDDVTARTLPTYAARRRLYQEMGSPEGVATIDRVERLALRGAWEYHVLAFRRTAVSERSERTRSTVPYSARSADGSLSASRRVHQ
jgi:hypothetical protein